MDVTNPKIGAAQFAILTSLANIGLIVFGTTTAGSLISILGYSRVFLISAWVFGPALIILYFIRRKNEIKVKDNSR
jgi:hypothetical protein